MKNRFGYTLLLTLLLSLMHTSSYSQFKAQKIDTTGFGNIQSRLLEFEPIVLDITGRIDQCSALDSIKMTVFVVGDIANSIVNDMAPIFDNFYAAHPEQYGSLKNISDLSDNIIKAKDISKAKKYNQKMITEYNNLLKAK